MMPSIMMCSIMTRSIILSLLAMSLSFGQSTRDTYRAAYKAWRETAAGLESDASAPSTKFEARTASAAKAAQNFLNARGSFFSDTGALGELPWASRAAVRPEVLLAARPEVHRLLTGTDGILAKGITTFAGVKDPAIQEVRRAMERERAALNDLIDALAKREARVEGLTETVDESERLRSRVTKKVAGVNDGRSEILKGLRVEGVAWARFYADLAEGAGSPPATK